MAYKEVFRVDVTEVIRRWQMGNSQRQTASGTGLSRDTVRKYIAAAKELGVVREGQAPTEEQLSKLAALSWTGSQKKATPAEEKLEPWADQIYQWVTVDRLQVTRIQELLAQRGCEVSYTSLRRFLQRKHWRRRNLRTVRMEQSAPGEVAELDFGRLGYVVDQETGRRCTVWALLVVLAYSRHSFLWPTCSQKLEEVIVGLEAAWEFFGGIPKYLVIDNFPAAVAGVDALHPRLTRGFLEYSQHRGFITDPARVRHPKDKPMVERSVQYARERFFKGGDFKDLNHLRSEAARWCRDVAGMRIHGTTRRQPLQVFLDEEQLALLPWDGEPYEATHWRTAKVHPDHHVACQYALYSVPSTLCPPGQQVEVGLGLKLVRIFHRGQLIKVHHRQPKGGRSTDTADYPAELSAYTLRAPDGIKRSAAEQGLAVGEFAQRLFDGALPWSRIRQGHKLLRLGQRYTPERLDAACRRALEVDLIDVGRVERILLQALEQAETPEQPPPLPAGRFARPGEVFAHAKGQRHRPTESTELKTGGQS